MEQAVIWADVKSNIVVKEALATFGSWEIHEAGLILMECDSRAQRTFFRTFEVDSCGSKQIFPAFWRIRIGTIWWVDSPKSYLPKKQERWVKL